MNEANELVVAVAEDAAEVDDAEDGEDPLEEEGEDGHLHQIFADLNVIRLNVLQLLRELRLLLHVACLFFAASVAHFLAHVVHVVLVRWVIVSEKTHSLLAGDLSIVSSCLALPAATIHPLTTFVRILRLISSSIVALSRKTGLVN